MSEFWQFGARYNGNDLMTDYTNFRILAWIIDTRKRENSFLAHICSIRKLIRIIITLAGTVLYFGSYNEQISGLK